MPGSSGSYRLHKRSVQSTLSYRSAVVVPFSRGATSLRVAGFPTAPTPQRPSRRFWVDFDNRFLPLRVPRGSFFMGKGAGEGPHAALLWRDHVAADGLSRAVVLSLQSGLDSAAVDATGVSLDRGLEVC